MEVFGKIIRGIYNDEIGDSIGYCIHDLKPVSMDNFIYNELIFLQIIPIHNTFPQQGLFLLGYRKRSVKGGFGGWHTISHSFSNNRFLRHAGQIANYHSGGEMAENGGHVRDGAHR